MAIGVSDGTQFPDMYSLYASYHDAMAQDNHDQDVHNALVGLGYPDDQEKPTQLAANDRLPLSGEQTLNPDVLGSSLDKAFSNKANDLSGNALGGMVKSPIQLKDATESPGGYRTSRKQYDVIQNGENVGRMEFAFPRNDPGHAHLEWAGRGDITHYGGGPNTLGASVVRQAFREFVKLHPEVNRITADRISGGRASQGGQSIDFKVENGRLKLSDESKFNADDLAVQSRYRARFEQQPLETEPAYDTETPTHELLSGSYPLEAEPQQPFNTYDPDGWRSLYLRNEQGQFLQHPNNLPLSTYGQAQWRNVMQNEGMPRRIDPTQPATSIREFGQSLYRQRLRDEDARDNEEWLRGGNNNDRLTVTPPKQELGIMSPSNSGVMQEAAQMGAHADWDKFAAEQRPSTNIEDDRMRQKTPGEILQDLNPIDNIPNGISNIMYR